MMLKGKLVESMSGRNQKPVVKQKRKWNLPTVLRRAGLAAVAATFLVLFILNPSAKSDEIAQSSFSLGYTVSFDNETTQILQVVLKMDITRLSAEKTIYLSRGSVDVPLQSCKDDNGSAVAYRDNGDLIAIGPIANNAKSVLIHYAVKLGEQTTGEDNATKYTNGALYSNLLVFQGKNVLMTPMMNPSEITSPERYINRVSFRLKQNKGWQGILPFQKPLSKICSFTVERPGWVAFNSISQSSFCFGGFEALDSANATGNNANLYVDKGVSGKIPQDSLQALVSLIRFYTGVFGQPLGDTPLVLLRSNPEDSSVILGGVGSGSAAISIGLRTAGDCKVLSKTIYSAFFDSKVKSPNLRYSPNNWIYQGLASYYVEASASALPDGVKNTYSVDTTDNFPVEYLRYLYFSLKEPGFLTLKPDDESSMYSAQREYYMQVKVPLMIDVINYTIYQKTGGSDGLLKALTEQGKSEKTLDIGGMIDSLCGSDAAAVRSYFSGTGLIPNYRGVNLDQLISRGDIVTDLDNCEQYFSGLFENQKVYYPYEPLVLLKEASFRQAAQAQGVHYNSTEIQSEVKGFSDTLDQLLLQYAYMARMAGVNDVTQPNIAQTVYQDKTLRQWRSFCQKTGYEVKLS